MVMVDASYPDLRAERADVVRAALLDLFDAQQFDVLMASRVLGKRWDERLAAELLRLNMDTATAVGDRLAAELDAALAFNPVLMTAWLTINADMAALSINDSTREALKAAPDRDAKAAVFGHLRRAADGYATSAVTTAANLGAHDAAEAGGQRWKVWRASSRSLRHSKMNGVKVGLSDTFQVGGGMRWPGDPAGGADEVANCKCSIAFSD
jgi:type V secretory pathway adhesin AidA